MTINAMNTVHLAASVMICPKGTLSIMAEKIQQLTQSTDLPNFYFNGFQLGLSNADINGLLLLNSQPHIGLSMSYTTAKSLSAALNQMVEALESSTGSKVLTNKEIAVGIGKLNLDGGNDGQQN